ncbi:hypothetical protein AB0M12_12290 [Nocardia vinacea]|uniref:hypothetical protein n=1 Tax=Nocardia vinacea TaxID=96468 RepID=UPI003441D358
MDRWARERVGRYRPKVPHRVPRAIPDQRFNELFAALRSNRDRALVAFWISSGVRASELLGVRHCDIDPSQQLITVVRKGTRAVQQVPASADAFVWLRLYQEELHGQIPRGRTQPVWSGVLAHHARTAEQRSNPAPPPPAPGYDPQALSVLFGRTL